MDTIVEQPGKYSLKNDLCYYHEWYHLGIMHHGYDVMRRALYLCGILPNSNPGLILKKENIWNNQIGIHAKIHH